MTTAIALMLVLTVFMLVVLISNRLPVEVVALLVMVLLGLFHLLPTSKLFSGFSSEAVITIIAVMILAAGLAKTGVTTLLSHWLLKRAKDDPQRTLWWLMLTTGVLAGIMRSIGAMALLLPIVRRISLLQKVRQSKFLLPVSFAAITGGTLTMLGSGPILVLNNILGSMHEKLHLTHQLKPLHLFTVTPVGICLLLAVMVFFRLCGNRLIPHRQSSDMPTGVDAFEFRRSYGFGGEFFEVVIPGHSDVSFKNLGEFEDALEGWKIAVVAVHQNHELYCPPLRTHTLLPETRLALIGKAGAVQAFCKQHGLSLLPKLEVFHQKINPARVGFSEIVIPPGSELVGKGMGEMHMRRNYDIQVISVYRNDRERHGREMHEMTLRAGDMLGVFSRWDRLAKLDGKPGFAVVTSAYPKETYRPHKTKMAMICVFIALVLLFLTPLNFALSLLVGTVAMLVTGVIKPSDAYASVSWRTVLMLAGFIPFGLAMEQTGAAAWLAHFLVMPIIHWPHGLILAAIALLASVFSLLMSNVGATVVLAPIAMHIAVSIGADPRLFAIATALATSNAFILPTHQVNALIASPGGYRNSDFMFIGTLVTFVYLVVLLAGCYLFLSW